MSESAEELSVHQGQADAKGKRVSPWAWVLTVNYAQGFQYIFVTNLAIIIWFTMGVDTGSAAFAASLLGLPWTLKPLWGPLVDRYWTKRNWTAWMQCAVAVCFGVAAFMLNMPAFFALTVSVFVILAFAAATHDIACDGYYMLALNERQQAFFVGIRSSCFRLGWVTATGALPFLAGYIQDRTGPPPIAIVAQTVSSIDNSNVSFDEYAAMGGGATSWDGPSIVANPTKVVLSPDGETTVSLTLSAAPPAGKPLSVLTTFAEGDKGISVKSGGRIEFTAENWNTPQTVLIRADKKTSNDVSAEFKISAGNVPLSWAVVFGTGALIMFGIFAWNQVMLPYPRADAADTENRPSIFRPLSCLLAVIAIPVAYFWFFGFLFGKQLYTPLMEAVQPRLEAWLASGVLTDGRDPAVVAAKGFKFFFNTLRVLVLLGGAGILLILTPVGTMMLNYFRSMSRASGIGFAEPFETFFSKPGMWAVIGFLLTFRLGEIQISIISNVFLLDTIGNGGLGLTLNQFSWVKGVLYLLALLAGGLLGGMVIAKYGLKRVIWPFVASVHLPNLLYVYMAYNMPESMRVVELCVGIEAFGYGFGLPAFLMVMIQAADGAFKTSHYALCTGFMALGAMIPGLFSGFLADLTGYPIFFILVMVFCVPGLFFIPYLPIRNFGNKPEAEESPA